jgi:hypothetical protein
MKERITPSEAGPIHHREDTDLSGPRRCVRGHIAPGYASNRRQCAVCNKMLAYALRYGPGGAPSRRHMQRWPDYAAAREHYVAAGGYLLRLAGGVYGTTDNEARVRRLRGQQWLDHCDLIQCWDEVEIASHAGRARRA